MKKKSPRRYAAFLVILSLFLFSAGCQKKNVKTAGPSADSREPDTVEKITMNRSGSGGEKSEGEEPEKEDSPSPGSDQFSGPLFLQQILPQSRILPDGDFCGPFMDSFSSDQTERDAAHLVQNFFNSYSQGIMDERFLLKNRNTLFQNELEEFLIHSAEIKSFYTGSFQVSGARASLRIRLFSEGASITGTLYLAADEESWFLEDWELPLAQWPGTAAPDDQ